MTENDSWYEFCSGEKYRLNLEISSVISPCSNTDKVHAMVAVIAYTLSNITKTESFLIRYFGCYLSKMSSFSHAYT